MATNLSQGPLQVFAADILELNDTFRRIRQELDALSGLAGPVTIYSSLTVNGSVTATTGLTLTGLTAGSILFGGPNATVAQDNANLAWDDTNNRLGVGTNTNLTERIVMPNASFLGGVNAAGSATQKLIGLNSSNNIRMDFATQTTVGAAGGASALPATPTGYILIDIAGTTRVIPFYAQA